MSDSTQHDSDERADRGPWLTTGEMARRSGTTLRTVRFYESEGLIASMARADGTHRRFPIKEFHKLQVISDLRESGQSLQELKDLIAIKSRNPTAIEAACDVTTAVCAQLETLDRRIETLQRVRQELVSTVSTLRACTECKEPGFPERCNDCTVVNHPNSSRATHLLWKN